MRTSVKLKELQTIRRDLAKKERLASRALDKAYKAYDKVDKAQRDNEEAIRLEEMRIWNEDMTDREREADIAKRSRALAELRKLMVEEGTL